MSASNESDPITAKSLPAKGDVELTAYDKKDAEGVDMAAMGYTQELKRNLSMWTVLGLGAAIIAAPFGLSTSASFSLINGQWLSGSLCMRERHLLTPDFIPHPLQAAQRRTSGAGSFSRSSRCALRPVWGRFAVSIPAAGGSSECSLDSDCFRVHTPLMHALYTTASGLPIWLLDATLHWPRS